MKPSIWRRTLCASSSTQFVAAVADFRYMVVLLIGFSIADPHFMRMGNIVALLLASAVTGIQALGVTFTIATGGIDITPGLGMAMTGVITAMCMTAFHLPIWLAVLAGILSGAVLG
ncbi:MAG: hypothetical protein ACLR2M_04535, partial [Varibaculum sp.]